MHKDLDVIRRAWGCMLGQIAGDSLGSQVEFKPADVVRAMYPDGMEELEGSALYRTLPGQPTDDSEMALALARTLLRTGTFDAESIMTAYKDWKKTHPVDFAHSVFRAVHGKVDAKSRSNSALMRVSPLGIFGARHIPETALPCADGAQPDLCAMAENSGVSMLMNWAMEEAALTNPHPLCQVASAAYVVALAYGIRSGSREGMYQAALAVCTVLGRNETLKEAAGEVRSCLERAAKEAPADFQEDMSFVLTALQNGFYRLLNSTDGGEAVRDTVLRGGDSAANGAVAGALKGAAMDIDCFPAQWVDAVLACVPEEGRPGVTSPRPKEYWPSDFMPLAEALLG